MEKIFDIAKDNEQKWGVIAQGIDGNFEEVSSNVNELDYLVKPVIEEMITRSANLLDQAKMEIGGLNPVDGTVTSTTNLMVSNQIKVEKGKTISFWFNAVPSIRQLFAKYVCAYNRDGKFISSSSKDVPSYVVVRIK